MKPGEDSPLSRMSIEVPDEALISLKTDSESFARELVLLAAVEAS